MVAATMFNTDFFFGRALTLVAELCYIYLLQLVGSNRALRNMIPACLGWVSVAAGQLHSIHGILKALDVRDVFECLNKTQKPKCETVTGLLDGHTQVI